MDYILSEINKLGADGVDFIPISDLLAKKQYHLCKVIASYTKEKWIASTENRCIPKTPYIFWKIVNGNKTYL